MPSCHSHLLFLALYISEWMEDPCVDNVRATTTPVKQSGRAFMLQKASIEFEMLEMSNIPS